MKSKKLIINLSLIAFSILSVTSGSASWVLSAKFETNNYKNESSTPVAYIKETNEYFYTIERALLEAQNDESSRNVYVIPGTNPTISSKCTIASNTTLNIPYSGENITNDPSSYSDDALYGFSYPNNITNTVTIEPLIDGSATLTIDGTLQIGGLRCSLSPQSATSGQSGAIILEENAKIICNGTIINYGFILEDSDYNDSSIIFSNNSQLTTQLIIYDWGAASEAMAANNEKIFPFNLFDIAQVSTKLIFNEGSKLYVNVWAYGDSAGNMYGGGYIIGNSSDTALIKPTSNTLGAGYVIWKNTDSNSGNAISNSTTTHNIDVEVYGNYNLASISISITSSKMSAYNMDINSADYFISFSNFFNLTIKTGSVVNLLEKVKLMPGSVVTIEHDAILNINNNLIVLDSRQNPNNSSQIIYRYPINSPAQLINNGTINLNANLGGTIIAGPNGNKNTKVVVNSNGDVTSNEIYGYETSFIIFKNALMFSVTKRATGNISGVANTEFQVGQTYTYENNNGNCYWVGEVVESFKDFTLAGYDSNGNSISQNANCSGQTITIKIDSLTTNLNNYTGSDLEILLNNNATVDWSIEDDNLIVTGSKTESDSTSAKFSIPSGGGWFGAYDATFTITCTITLFGSTISHTFTVKNN